jgi:sugar phosphate isomerase/epimerase
MNNDYKLKVSAKGSRKIGKDFVEETEYLAGIVDCIEIDLNFPHDNNFTKEIDFLKKLSSEKCTKYTVHAQYLNGSMNDFNQDVREATIKELHRNIDIASELGSEIIVLHPALEPYGWKLERRIELEIEAYRRLADYAQTKHIKIGLENEAQTCFWFPDRACKFELLEQTVNIVDRPNFGITLDFGHASVSGEDYISVVKKFGEKIFHVHSHDNFGKSEDNLAKFNRADPHLAVGSGVIKWKDVVNTLRDINYQGYFELENEIREIEAGVKYISQL